VWTGQWQKKQCRKQWQEKKTSVRKRGRKMEAEKWRRTNGDVFPATLATRNRRMPLLDGKLGMFFCPFSVISERLVSPQGGGGKKKNPFSPAAGRAPPMGSNPRWPRENRRAIIPVPCAFGVSAAGLIAFVSGLCISATRTTDAAVFTQIESGGKCSRQLKNGIYSGPYDTANGTQEFRRRYGLGKEYSGAWRQPHHA